MAGPKWDVDYSRRAGSLAPTRRVFLFWRAYLSLFVIVVMIAASFAYHVFTTPPTEAEVQKNQNRQYYHIVESLPPNSRVLEHLGNGWYTVQIPVRGREQRFLVNTLNGGINYLTINEL